MNIYIIFALFILVFLSILLLPVFMAKDIPVKHKLVFSFSAAVFFMGGGLLLYQQFGTPEILPMLAAREEKLSVLKEKITAASAAVQKNPKNLKAWAELGDDFMETSQFSASANAYKQAVLLSGGNPVFIMAYSRALIMEADGEVTDDAKKSLDIVLVLQPENEEARYFMAVRKLQSGNSREAMAEMKELYKSLADGSPLKAMIDRQIGRQSDSN